MEWKETALADCCESIYDGDHQAPPMVKDGVSCLSISDVVHNQIVFPTSLHTTETYYKKLSPVRTPKKDDILYSVVGSIGIPIILRVNRRFAFQRQFALLRPNKDVIIPEFLFYTLLNPRFRLQAEATAIGTAQKIIKLNVLRNINIHIPQMSVQRKIVELINPYDALIENHRRQIALLEEAAQRIYKKWFVDTPSAHCKLTLSPLPELVEVCYGKDHQGLPAGQYPVYGSGGCMRKVNQFLYDKESILIPRKGTLNNILYVDEPFWTVDTMFYTKIKRPNIGFYLYNYLLRIDMYAMNTGAAVPSMTTNVLNKLMIPLPPPAYLMRFSDTIAPMHHKIKLLMNEITLLQEARDRLLPKLMSGEIEVS